MGEIQNNADVELTASASTEVPEAVSSHINGQTNGIANGTTDGTKSTAENSSQDSYKILEEPSRSGRPIKVIAIGAGASALNFAHDVDTGPLKIELVCYEKNPEIGGTW